MKDDRANAEAAELPRGAGAPVAAVQAFEASDHRCRGPRRGRRVAARSLALRRRVVPEVDAAVVDAGIEDRQLQDAPPSDGHGSGGIARRGLPVHLSVKVDEEDRDGERRHGGVATARDGVCEERRDAESGDRHQPLGDAREPKRWQRMP